MGLILFIAGISVLVMKQRYDSVSNMLTSPAAVALIVGIIILLSAICGFVGAIKEHLLALRIVSTCTNMKVYNHPLQRGKGNIYLSRIFTVGSNFVSAGQCHLIHLTISWFSWPSLAYMCTKVA